MRRCLWLRAASALPCMRCGSPMTDDSKAAEDDDGALDELLAEDDDTSKVKAAMAAASRFVKKIDMDFSCLDFSNPALQV